MGERMVTLIEALGGTDRVGDMPSIKKI